MVKFNEWFDTFLGEKNLPSKSWEIEDSNSVTHFIDAAVVIEHIKFTSPAEKSKIKDILVKIDFHNGDVLHFFEHLAKGLVANYSARS